MWRQRISEIERRLSGMERSIKEKEERIRDLERQGKNKDEKIKDLEKLVRESNGRMMILERRVDELNQGDARKERREGEAEKDPREGEKGESWRRRPREKREDERRSGEERERKGRREDSRATYREEERGEEQWRKVEVLKERGLLVKKGRGNKGEGLRNWINQMLEREVELERELERGEEGGWIVFKQKKDRDNLFELEDLAREEGIHLVDEWLSMEERATRYELMEKAREIERKAKEKGEEIFILRDNRFLRIDGRKYIWNKKENKLERAVEKIEWEIED